MRLKLSLTETDPMPPPSILYADDNILLVPFVKGALELAGCAVTHCSNGVYARVLIESKQHYDLLLLDDDLPSMGGLELIRRTRKARHREKTPIILMSLNESEQIAREAGADEFLQKPNNLVGLVDTVRNLLAARAVE